MHPNRHSSSFQLPAISAHSYLVPAFIPSIEGFQSMILQYNVVPSHCESLPTPPTTLPPPSSPSLSPPKFSSPPNVSSSPNKSFLNVFLPTNDPSVSNGSLPSNVLSPPSDSLHSKIQLPAEDSLPSNGSLLPNVSVPSDFLLKSDSPSSPNTTRQWVGLEKPDEKTHNYNTISDEKLQQKPIEVKSDTKIFQSYSTSSLLSNTAEAWAEYKAPDGKTYFYNMITNQSFWSTPDHLKSRSELLLAQCPWKECIIKEGRAHYHNVITDESRWTIPRELEEIRKKILEEQLKTPFTSAALATDISSPEPIFPHTNSKSSTITSAAIPSQTCGLKSSIAITSSNINLQKPKTDTKPVALNKPTSDNSNLSTTAVEVYSSKESVASARLTDNQLNLSTTNSENDKGQITPFNQTNLNSNLCTTTASACLNKDNILKSSVVTTSLTDHLLNLPDIATTNSTKSSKPVVFNKSTNSNFDTFAVLLETDSIKNCDLISAAVATTLTDKRSEDSATTDLRNYFEQVVSISRTNSTLNLSPKTAPNFSEKSEAASLSDISCPNLTMIDSKSNSNQISIIKSTSPNSSLSTIAATAVNFREKNTPTSRIAATTSDISVVLEEEDTPTVFIKPSKKLLKPVSEPLEILQNENKFIENMSLNALWKASLNTFETNLDDGTFEQLREKFSIYENQKTEEENMSKAKSKKQLEEFLFNCGKISSATNYHTCKKLFVKSEIWNNVNDIDRKKIYKDVIDTLKQRERQEKKILKKQTKKFAEILVRMIQINCDTTWSEAQIMLSTNPVFKNDVNLCAMDDKNAFRVFSRYIQTLKIKQCNKILEETKRLEAKNIEKDYLALLDDLHKKGQITYMTSWEDVFAHISADKCFFQMVCEQGLSPQDLFTMHVAKLKEKFSNDQKLINIVLGENNFQLKADTSFDQFKAVIHGDLRCNDLDEKNIKVAYNCLLEKIRTQIEKESKTHKKLENEFKSLLRKINIDFKLNWEEVKPKIEDKEEYVALNSDSDRIRIYEDYQREMKDLFLLHYQYKAKKLKQKKRNKNKSSSSNDSDSEKASISSKRRVNSNNTLNSEESGEEYRKKKKRRKRQKTFSEATPKGKHTKLPGTYEINKKDEQIQRELKNSESTYSFSSAEHQTSEEKKIDVKSSKEYKMLENNFNSLLRKITDMKSSCKENILESKHKKSLSSDTDSIKSHKDILKESTSNHQCQSKKNQKLDCRRNKLLNNSSDLQLQEGKKSSIRYARNTSTTNSEDEDKKRQNKKLKKKQKRSSNSSVKENNSHRKPNYTDSDSELEKETRFFLAQLRKLKNEN